MKERILVVEDMLENALSALIALGRYDGVEDAVVAGSLSHALKIVNEFKPTVALLDINIPGGSGTEVGRELDKRRIPYVYVTGVGRDNGHGHSIVDAIEIKDKNLKTLLRYERCSKDPEIWQRAYEILQNGTN
ncbi:MAG: response regulator [Planctomycetes bacterium]|jgi:CheY-like chemotaxis protein|nr:response regulator [Planctomycetota bacterium]